MSYTPNFNHKIQQILEATEPGERFCSFSGQTWQLTQEELFWCHVFNVPPPTQDPFVRLKRLIGSAVGASIWWNVHAKTGNPLLAFVHPDNPQPVITDLEWMQNIPPEGPHLVLQAPFFEQMRQLLKTVPHGAMRDEGSAINSVSVDMINSEDVFMAFAGDDCKRVTHGILVVQDEDCVDVANTTISQGCFQTGYVHHCYNCFFAFHTFDSMNSAFLFDCRNCEYCFGATNKRNKKYLWWNEQLSKEEWERRRVQVDLSSFPIFHSFRQRFFDLMKTRAVWPQQFSFGNQESSGEYVEKCTRSKDVYWLRKSTDTYRCWIGEKISNSAYGTWTGLANDTYACNGCVAVEQLKFCDQVWKSLEMEYCYDCHDCEYCFGCIGLYRKKFHILNRPYPEQDYWKRVDELKCAMLDRGEYGEYFPGDFSGPGLVFSMGSLLFDYTPEELLYYQAPLFDATRGNKFPGQQISTIKEFRTEEIPDHLEDAFPLIGKPIFDRKIGRSYSVRPQEYAFYKEKQLPFPREHFLTTLKFLMRTSNSPIPEDSQCHHCRREIQTYKNHIFVDRRVLCQSCYLSFLETHG